jgi:putative ABC transport system permease protein
MRMLDRKLWRDLWDLRGQAIAVAVVIAGGVATLVMSLNTLRALERTRAAFYHDLRFADVFASLKRAPENVAEALREVDGVAQLETRVAAWVQVEIEGFTDPISGQIVSLPAAGDGGLNTLFLRSGDRPRQGADHEVVVSEPFAEAHEFVPGDRFTAIIRGRREVLTITGIALSAEFIYQIRPGALIPDFSTFGIFWMNRDTLASAYDMEGAFNDVVATLAPGASLEDALDGIDRVLEPYGGQGAYARAEQVSHHFLSEEFRSLEAMATIFPTIFLGVAAFLLSIIVRRMVSTQREQIAILKAFGYRNAAIGSHFARFVVLIVVVGVALGILAGYWLGLGLGAIYKTYYRFPTLDFSIGLETVLISLVVGGAAAGFGTWRAVRAAVTLPPAEAMRPEPPSGYKETWMERLGLRRLLSHPNRKIHRNMSRRAV